ncbi:MAG TPA: TrkA family potassium uptake protein [Geobacteraceae bacterium]
MYVIIVGGGKVGAYLANLLSSGGERVKVIEERRENIPALQRELPLEAVMQGSGTDPLVLEAAGIRQANVVAAVTGEDETNLVVAGLARSEFGVTRVIARVNDPKNAWMFTPKMGVDVALNQADLLAHLIAEEMSVGEMMTLLKLRKGEYSLVEEKVHPLSQAAGKAVQDIGLPAECVIAAVIRRGKLLIPRGNLVLEPEDEVLAVVHSGEMTKLAAILGPAEAP